jgi:deazaflavin-dependent oxidoreductase (nitroreductase family)
MHTLMIDWDHPTDPGPGPLRDHVRAYVATAGADGLWHGIPTLLLTTADPATGRTVRTPLIYGRDDDRYVVLAAEGTWHAHLRAHPEVRVQAGPAVLRATARTATAAERDTYWEMMTALWPAYEDYRTALGTEIPLVLIDPLP